MTEKFLGSKKNKGGVGWFWGLIFFLILGLSGYAAYKAYDPGITVAYLVVSFDDKSLKKEKEVPSHHRYEWRSLRIIEIKEQFPRKGVISSGEWTPVF